MKRLDQVKKPKGYKFNSTVLAVFKNLSGETRVVAENKDGIIHIFAPEQLIINNKTK